MFRGNLAHTGVYNAVGVQKFSKIKWKFHTDGQVISSPAVAGGTVYVGSTDGSRYAVDLASGTQKWKFPTEVRVTSSPAVDQGVAYFGSYDGKFYAVDGASGQLKWKFATGGERRFAGKHLHGSEPAATRSMPPVEKRSGASRQGKTTTFTTRSAFNPLPLWRTGWCTLAAAMPTSMRSTPAPDRKNGLLTTRAPGSSRRRRCRTAKSTSRLLTRPCFTRWKLNQELHFSL